MTEKRISPDHWQRARELRKPLTPAEKTLWQALRNGKLGTTFRRQHPIPPCIVDFVALDASLILELDGSVHSVPGHSENDATRQEFLEAKGFRVLRFENCSVLHNLPEVLNAIRAVLAVRI